MHEQHEHIHQHTKHKPIAETIKIKCAQIAFNLINIKIRLTNEQNEQKMKFSQRRRPQSVDPQ